MAPTTSRRASRARPIESAELTIRLPATRDSFSKISAVVPGARLEKGVCRISLSADGPAELAAEARKVLLGLKDALEPPKAFK